MSTAAHYYAVGHGPQPAPGEPAAEQEELP